MVRSDLLHEVLAQLRGDGRARAGEWHDEQADRRPSVVPHLA